MPHLLPSHPSRSTTWSKPRPVYYAVNLLSLSQQAIPCVCRFTELFCVTTTNHMEPRLDAKDNTLRAQTAQVPRRIGANPSVLPQVLEWQPFHSWSSVLRLLPRPSSVGLPTRSTLLPSRTFRAAAAAPGEDARAVASIELRPEGKRRNQSLSCGVLGWAFSSRTSNTRERPKNAAPFRMQTPSFSLWKRKELHDGGLSTFQTIYIYI